MILWVGWTYINNSFVPHGMDCGHLCCCIWLKCLAEPEQPRRLHSDDKQLVGVGHWQGPLRSPLMALFLHSSDGLPHSMAAEFQNHGSACAPHHFPCILLAKASHKASPDSTGGETESTSWCRRSLCIQGEEKLLVARIKDNLPTLSSYDNAFISTEGLTSLHCAW